MVLLATQVIDEQERHRHLVHVCNQMDVMSEKFEALVTKMMSVPRKL